MNEIRRSQNCVVKVCEHHANTQWKPRTLEIGNFLKALTGVAVELGALVRALVLLGHLGGLDERLARLVPCAANATRWGGEKMYKI
jgi:hypothetical protein